MSKDPAFLFYPNDYIGGTMGMSFEEKGAYIELLMMQFNRGHMSGHMCGQVVGQLWDKIQDKFQQDDKGLWFNERLEIEQNKRKAFTASRKNNLKGINQYTKKTGLINGHMTSYMENENEDTINVYTKNDFLRNWNELRNHYLKTPSNLNSLPFQEQILLKQLSQIYKKEDFQTALKGLFKQEAIPKPVMTVNPKHFLSNFEQYLDAEKNKLYKLYT